MRMKPEYSASSTAAEKRCCATSEDKVTCMAEVALSKGHLPSLSFPLPFSRIWSGLAGFHPVYFDENFYKKMSMTVWIIIKTNKQCVRERKTERERHGQAEIKRQRRSEPDIDIDSLQCISR